MVDKVRAAGGEIYAVTSEPQRLADLAREGWELNFETVGDPHHEISSLCQQRGWLELIVNTETALFDDDLYSHPKGYFQPGVLALNKAGRVLYRWRSIPTRRNIGGAVERPTAGHVFDHVSKALHQPDIGDAESDLDPELDSRGLPFVLFVPILLANGWFIKPKVFAYTSGAAHISTRIKRAIMRIPFFILAWLAAFIWIPTPWVLVAAAAYAAWLTPHIRFFGRQFQSIKP